MGKKGGSAPKPDKNIGIAALRSAELGEDYLEWMKGQSAISNGWADEDRARYIETFQPLQDQFIQEAQDFDTPEARAEAVRLATDDVKQQGAMAQSAQRRELSRMGVDPNSGRYASATTRAATATGLASAGAANTARRTIESTGRSLRAAAVDLGSGMAVNPATSLGMAGNSMSAGFSGAMQGQQQKGSMLTSMDNQRMEAWRADQQSSGQLWGGIGSIAGLALASSKEYKHDRKKVDRSLLKEIRKMPVEDWTYNEGIEDGKRHTGPIAEDFKKATGKGDGKSIPVLDIIGTSMGALQELDRKVEALSRKIVARPDQKKAA